MDRLPWLSGVDGGPQSCLSLVMIRDEHTVYIMAGNKVKGIKNHQAIVPQLCMAKKRLANTIEVKYVLSRNQVACIMNEH